MADVKISALPAATTPLAGTEVLPIVQSSTTKQVSIANVTAGRAISASSLTLTTPLSVASGGTGLTSLTAGYIPYGNGTGAFSSGAGLQFDGTNLGIGGAASSFGSGYRTISCIGTSGAGVFETKSTSVTGRFQADESGLMIVGSISSHPLSLWTNGNERLRITSAGDVGIGTTSPSYALDVRGQAGDGSYSQFNLSGTSSSLNVFSGNSSGVLTISADDNNAGAGSSINFRVDNAEHARIDSIGNLLVGTTSGGTKLRVADSANQVTVLAENTNASFNSEIFSARPTRNTTNGSFYAFSYYNNTAAAYRFYVTDAGRVYGTGTYVDLSDISQKENIRDLELGLSSILSLKPRRFNWREGVGDGQDNKIGFIAQEVEEVLPDVVNDWGDKNAPLKGVATAEITPVLVRAIQELAAKVSALEAKQ